MRTLPILVAVLLPLGACAQGPQLSVEQGYPRGALAVAAIDRGDYRGAERLLADSPLSANDPARLINLGYVYLQQGRRDAAVNAWRQAALHRHAHDLVTLNGREVTSGVLARELIARFQAPQRN